MLSYIIFISISLVICYLLYRGLVAVSVSIYKLNHGYTTDKINIIEPEPGIPLTKKRFEGLLKRKKYELYFLVGAMGVGYLGMLYSIAYKTIEYFGSRI